MQKDLRVNSCDEGKSGMRLIPVAALLPYPKGWSLQNNFQ
jgi:hypothetical protein